MWVMGHRGLSVLCLGPSAAGTPHGDGVNYRAPVCDPSIAHLSSSPDIISIHNGNTLDRLTSDTSLDLDSPEMFA